MAIRVGILGLGFMGKCHYEAYKTIRGAEVAAICDIDSKKRSGDWSGIAGNIGGAGKKEDLSGLSLYANADELFSDPSLDVIDITLPTYLHAEFAKKALASGKHVICEKPMARTSKEATSLVSAARKAKRQIYVAQCIRFWPAYATAREIIRSGKYGQTLSATFRRLSITPTWSWKNWLMDSDKSGDAALDLHIHDADFVRYCFGSPRSVSADASGFKPGRADHIIARYEYEKNLLVTAEGGWIYQGTGYPFEMSFQIAMQKACLRLSPDGVLTLHPNKGKPNVVKLPAKDGYQQELSHYIECIKSGRPSPVVSPEDAAESVKLIESELKSITTGKPVKMV